MTLAPHTRPWYERLAQRQHGYFYPWRSTLPSCHGEDAYLELVRRHLAPDRFVVDAGCGHGEIPLEIAPLCRHVLAYDCTAAFIDLARELARVRTVDNVTFVCADALPDRLEGVDLFLSRLGPLDWITDVRRAARPGAVLLQLNPFEVAVPAWNGELPPELRLRDPGRESMRAFVEERLARASLAIDSCWTFDVPETFAAPADLYAMLAWGKSEDEAPPFPEVRPVLERIFARHAGTAGVTVRRGRFLWKAVVEDGAS
jgi:SAM-dependent methyltransferase